MLDATGPIKYANIDVSAAASTEVVAAVTGKKLRPLGVLLVAAGAVTVTIEDEDGNNLIGPMAFAANGGVAHSTEIGLQETPAGKALHILLDGAVQVGGSLSYQEV